MGDGGVQLWWGGELGLEGGVEAAELSCSD